MRLFFCSIEALSDLGPFLRNTLAEVAEAERLRRDLDRLRDRAGLNVCDERIEVREESAGGDR